jgi:hypothetical protein
MADDLGWKPMTIVGRVAASYRQSHPPPGQLPDPVTVKLPCGGRGDCLVGAVPFVGFRWLVEQTVAAGGWGGIRTHGTLARTAVFKTAAFNRSATHPIESKLRRGALHLKC